MRLSAIFEMTKTRIEYFATETSKEAAIPYKFQISSIEQGTKSRVIGIPQEIMFLISTVANFGEDKLISVKRIAD